MGRKRSEVPDAQLAVLEVLWQRGPATVRQLADALYPGDRSAYGTVQKLLERLEEKGHVRRERGAGAQVFEAAVSREELIGRQLRAVAEKLCGGSLTPLLTHLVRAKKLTAEEREALRALIEELDATRNPKPDRG
jgi:predicted transcriptional regulator